MVAADVEQLRASGQLRDSLTTDVQDDAELRGSKQGRLRESLTNAVVDAVKTSNRMSAPSRGDTSSASRLRPDAKLQLHGRDGDIQALRTRLRALAAKDREDDDDDDDPGRSPELLLVSGASGCGKSALVMRGLRDPAARMGLTFASGKFDQVRFIVAIADLSFCTSRVSFSPIDRIVCSFSEQEQGSPLGHRAGDGLPRQSGGGPQILPEDPEGDPRDIGGRGRGVDRGRPARDRPDAAGGADVGRVEEAGELAEQHPAPALVGAVDQGRGRGGAVAAAVRGAEVVEGRVL